MDQRALACVSCNASRINVPRQTHLIRDLALNDDLLVALGRLADTRARREALREELGRLLQVDAFALS